MRQRRKHTAAHEAGHAIAMFLTGGGTDIFEINMKRNSNSPARVMARDGVFDVASGSVVHLVWEASHKSPIAARALASREVLFLLAGPYAECRSIGCSKIWLDYLFDTQESDNLDHDLGKAVFATRAIADSDRKIDTFLRRVANWTEEAIGHPRAWAAVESLATHLCKRDSMTGAEAVDIIEAAWGDNSGDGPPIYQLGSHWRRRF